ncbi:MAG: hypothetical protein M1833_001883 [Piccolia ochrophora]|nr:MAG: hypothetical protein M1833_001883 [Piccolia ochrophora]
MSTLSSISPIAIKDDTSPGSTPLSTPTIVTKKEWVIPPRPKPGRKPATDTPPTKRKAQNRAAQRAFRERRAARVGELEEQMKENEGKVQREQSELKTEVSTLETEVDRLQEQLESWRQRCQDVEKDLDHERRRRLDAEREVQRINGQFGRRVDVGKPLSFNGSRSLDDPNHLFEKFASEPYTNQPSALEGCGNCTKDSRCECVEQALNISAASYQVDRPLDAVKRSHSPGDANSVGKRHRTTEHMMEHDPADLETDFTAFAASTKSGRADHESPSSVVSPQATDDPCGFCQDGTPCVCAELERQAAEQKSNEVRLAPMLSHFTPPPSESDVQTPSAKPQPVHPSMRRAISSSQSCAGGPGTCAQCRVDPNSTIFCKSLAASRSGGATADTPAAGCCGKSKQGSSCRPPSPRPALNSPYLSCADTYTALSRHPHYSEATDELGTWIGRLKTSLPGEEEGRPALEIEAASVMGILKFFDRRFGMSKE